MAVTNTAPRAMADLAITVGLLAALVLPAAGPVLGLDPARALNERRAKAPRPSWPRSPRAAWGFPAPFDSYFRDHFGFRSWLIRLHNRASLAMETRPTATVPVVIGRDRWLYYSGNDALRYMQGRNRFSDEALRNWVTCLQERSRWLAKRDARYLVVIAPGKQSIYPEHLPTWIRPATEGTRLDQLVKAVEGVPDIDLLDLRGALREAKRGAQVYYATDSHWNDLGAHAAYVAIIQRLARWFPTETAAPISQFELEWKRGSLDLSEMLGVEDSLAERFPVLVRRRPTSFKTVDAPAFAAPSRFPPIVTESRSARIERAVVFRDSFTTGLMPFLPEHFGRCAFLWTTAFDAGVVETERPVVVIQEYAEVFLSELNPVNPPEVSKEIPREKR
jgi:alginate O-acetyltransferase complex protein AlgJ